MRTETCHFWVGNFEEESGFFEFFGEDESYYDEDETEEKYLTEFAKSQDEQWFDHDFFECGFEEEALPFEEKFAHYSYADQWLPELKSRVEVMNIPVNGIAFITKDEIKVPVSVKTDRFELIYAGEITYEI